ncbi:hypothetical protein [Brevibacillus dissolubilis]|uniref:hypothetical protein n=1 Tax=Brevibacillus dissolubilis TaxID=1844116 RepID=UPI00111628DB|nr:hypothetical protein [Brevibacillus dissolubilis]
MTPTELITTYLAWTRAIPKLEHDAQLIELSTTKLSYGYAHVLRFLLPVARSMAFAAQKDLKRLDIRILAEHEERGELFLLWKHRGETHMLRMRRNKIQALVQAKVDELVSTINKTTPI